MSVNTEARSFPTNLAELEFFFNQLRMQIGKFAALNSQAELARSSSPVEYKLIDPDQMLDEVAEVIKDWNLEPNQVIVICDIDEFLIATFREMVYRVLAFIYAGCHQELVKIQESNIKHFSDFYRIAAKYGQTVLYTQRILTSEPQLIDLIGGSKKAPVDFPFITITGIQRMVDFFQKKGKKVEVITGVNKGTSDQQIDFLQSQIEGFPGVIYLGSGPTDRQIFKKLAELLGKYDPEIKMFFGDSGHPLG